MAAYVYKDKIILGTGGGDNGNLGLVSAFSIKDGKRLWDWQTIPARAARTRNLAGRFVETRAAPCGAAWPSTQATDTLFVAPGNPGPDMVLTGERARTSIRTRSWHWISRAPNRGSSGTTRSLQNDTHDDDPAMIPVLFEGRVDGQPRPLVAIGDKAGNFVLLDRNTGQVVHRLAVSQQSGLDTAPTLQGTEACPNHGGGIEWNGGAYDPHSNSFLIPSTEECAVFKIISTDPEYVPGQTYTGGPLPKRRNGTGVLTSIDVSTGRIRWRNALPYPADGGVLITATGLAFTSDVEAMSMRSTRHQDSSTGRTSPARRSWRPFPPTSSTATNT